jgi:peptidyl-prolyl cis-trans isomerase C
MKRMAVFTLIISILFLFASCAKQEEKKGPYLAKVGKVKITQADLDREMKNLPDFFKQIFEGSEGKERFLNEIVKKELLYQEALKQGLDKDAENIAKVADFKKNMLISQLVEKEIEDKAKVTEEDIKKFYDEHKEDFAPFDEIRLSLIRVETEDEAKKIEDELKKGEDFAQLAKEHSIDKKTAKAGGDLGFLKRDQLAPEHEMAVARLMKGDVSPPVRTEHGFEIIKITDKKTSTIVEFKEVKDLISQHLSAEKQKEVLNSYIENLKKIYAVEINKEALAGPAEEVQKPAEEQEETEKQKEIEKDTMKEAEKEEKEPQKEIEETKEKAKEVEKEGEKETEKAKEKAKKIESDTKKEIEKKSSEQTQEKEAQKPEQKEEPKQVP